MGLKDGELEGIDLRRDLDLVLAAAREADDPTALLAALAAADPIALAEVVCGPRSPGGAVLVRAALAHIAVLEQALSALGAWGRLVELGGAEFLGDAARAHPTSRWILKLSRKVEGKLAGATHLTVAAGHPVYASLCAMHVEAGAREGLVVAAERTARPEPVLALLPVDRQAAIRAAAAVLNADPDAVLIPWLAAAWSPEPDDLFVRIVPHLRHRRAAQALRAITAAQVATQRLLRTVLPSLPP